MSQKSETAPRLHPTLTDEEFLAAKKRALERIEKEKREEAIKAVEKEHYDKERARAGLIVGGALDELVRVTIDLPDPDINSCLLINNNLPGGTCYYHGFTYEVPRHVANTLNEMMFRLKTYSDREIHGVKGREYYTKKRGTAIAGEGGLIGGSLPQAVA